MKKLSNILKIGLLIFLIATLSACSKSNESTNKTNNKTGTNNIHNNMSDNISNKNTSSDKEIIKTDDKDLIKVRIKNGKAFISFNVDNWKSYKDQLIDISYFNIDNMTDKEFFIFGLSGKVIDAFVIPIEETDYFSFENLVIPTVFLIMDNGTVEHVFANPVLSEEFVDGYDGLFFSDGIVPFLEFIDKIEYVNSGGGKGENIPCAITYTGEKLQLPIIMEFMQHFETIWRCDFENKKGFLLFYKDGRIQYSLGDGQFIEDAAENWYGEYELILSDGKEYPPGTLVINMEKTTFFEENSKTESMKASYRMDFDSEYGLNLYYNTGDKLEGSSSEICRFTYNDFSDDYSIMESSPKDIKSSFINNLDEVKKALSNSEKNYNLFVTDDVCLLGSRILGRKVWLVEETEDTLRKDTLYAIFDDHRILRYDPSGDAWLEEFTGYEGEHTDEIQY